ncbi:MAG: sigma-70 family RNA polymerase sigma factor [Bacteroidales bacterium]|nr:sigma-70 family RNA polymerase sigma factor [Bacteroidales bacterium]
MNRVLYKDEEIINGLKNKDHETVRFFYRNYFESIHRLIIKNSGKTEDAEDVFQDSLMIIFKKCKNDELNLTCSLKTYVYAICKNLWLQRLQKKDFKKEELSENVESNAEPFELDEDLQEETKYNLYQKHFLELSKDCQKVLKLFLKKIKMEEITKIMRFSSIDYTKTRKYLCKKTLKEKILNDPEYMKYLV